ncbi:MAG: hypothetical protein ACK559_10470, partial [bacterium]
MAASGDVDNVSQETGTAVIVRSLCAPRRERDRGDARRRHVLGLTTQRRGLASARLRSVRC